MREPGYAELQVTTNFSPLRGGSHPHELVQTAAALGMAAIGVSDRNALAGLAPACLAAEAAGIRLIAGCRLDFRDGSPSMLCYPTDRAAYGRLCRLLEVGRRQTQEGEACLLDYEDLLDFAEGQIVVALAPSDIDEAFAEALAMLAADRPGCAYLGLNRRFAHDDARRVHLLAGLADRAGLPLLATNDVLYHVPERRRLQDVLTCMRHGCTIDEAGFHLDANAERHLKSPADMARLFADYPQALAGSLEIVERCAFSLAELRAPAAGTGAAALPEAAAVPAPDFRQSGPEELAWHIRQRLGWDGASPEASRLSSRMGGLVRDVGKALGLSAEAAALLADAACGNGEDAQASIFAYAHLDPHDRRLQLTLELAGELLDFPGISPAPQPSPSLPDAGWARSAPPETPLWRVAR